MAHGALRGCTFDRSIVVAVQHLAVAHVGRVHTLDRPAWIDRACASTFASGRPYVYSVLVVVHTKKASIGFSTRASLCT